MNHDDIQHPVAKFIAGLGLYFTIDMLTTVGKVAGAVLSILLLSEWLWKRVLRPMAVRMGYLNPKEKTE